MNDSQKTHQNQENKSPTLWTSKLFLQCLLALALVYTLYLAKTLLVPAVVALLLTLLLGPLVTFFRRFYVPRIVSAIVMLVMLTGPFTFLTIEIGEPIQRWAQLIPEFSSQLTEQLEELQSNLAGEETDSDQEEETSAGLLESFFAGEADEQTQNTESNPTMERLTQGGIEMVVYILSAAPVFLAQLVTCLVLTVFLLVFGANLFESAINNLPQINDKQRARSLVESVESELSRYILTVSVINAALGIATAFAFYAMGVDNAVLWGVLVALLNFAPYLGTFIGIAVLLMVGLAQYEMTLQALAPATVYFIINGLEAQFVTPTVLGRYMRINPLILMGWLIFWAWLWGFVGALLAVPLLVCMKLAARELGAPPYWSKVIETHGV